VLLIPGLAMAASSPPDDGPPVPAGASAERIDFADLSGFAADDHAAALRTLLVSCRARQEKAPALREGLAAQPALDAVCISALRVGEVDTPAARAFFERHFTPWRISGESGRGFFTGYFEPEVEGSLKPGGRYGTPVYARPEDLVTFPQGETPAGFEGFAAARKRSDGALEPYADRTAIEEGALAGLGLERAWLADPVDLFFVQVQGSGRIRLPDGSVIRLAYAGRNGHPYTAIGRVVADRFGIPRSDMTMDRLRAFLAEDADLARSIMRENRSYVFFRLATELDPALGPIGGEGVPLTPGRSLAIDRTLWPYGLPVFVAAELPTGTDAGLEPFRRLMIAQDTGSAILGPARADIFFGPGSAAGAIAGRVRHPGTFTVLWPKATTP
jgi:membrane-bound lytic murein transglycosylase A